MTNKKIARFINGEIYYEGEPLPEHAPAPKKRTKKEQQDIIGIRRFYREIPDEEAAIAFIENRIWGDTPYCPRCGNENVYRVKSGKPMSHRCRDCKRYFSVRTGTVMEDTNLPLQTWLLAIHLMHTDRKGVSSVQLAKMLEIGQHAAWFLEHRIREAMKQGDALMKGIVQIDETYVGGKERWKHADKKLHKEWPRGRITVFGIREDGPGGKIMAFPMIYPSDEDLRNAIFANVQFGSTVYTDGHRAYRNLTDYGYEHGWVEHRVGEYVDGKVTTNGIESFWAEFKGAYRGTFHHVTWWHLHRYLIESSFRHNAGPGNGFETIGSVLDGMPGKRITYKGIKKKKKDSSEDHRPPAPPSLLQ